MTSLWLAWQLGLSLWGVVSAWRRRPAPRVPLARQVATPSAARPQRLRWLRDWGGWILASSVGSLAPALAPDAPLWLQALLTLTASAGLLRLMHALDAPAVGHGVVAGLGLIGLFLDSLSGGAWARHGALGHGAHTPCVGELYGAIALLWGIVACRAWLSIEGNPLGAAYLMCLIALWLGWKGQTSALGWGATVAALTLSLMAAQREWTERRRLRLAMQNQPTRTVRIGQGYDLALHGILLLGLCGVALWCSGVPALQLSGLSAHEGWFAAIGIACGVGLWRTRPLRPLPTALQRAGLVGALATALLSANPLGIVALGLLIYWGLVGAALQETARPMSNLTPRTGGKI